MIRYKALDDPNERPSTARSTENIIGHVVDQNGKPLSNVRWRISTTEEWRNGQWELIHNRGMSPWSFTGNDGRFDLSFHGRQRFDLQFDGGTFAPAFLYEIAADTTNLTVTMMP